MNRDDILRLLATANFGVYAMSLDQRIVFWNRGAERILGHQADDVLGRRCFEVVAAGAQEGLSPACLDGCPSIRSLQNGMVPGAVTMELLCASGERTTVSLTPMVVSATQADAPMLIHLFDDAGEAESDLIAETVRSELSQSGADIVSDHPGAAPASKDPAPLTARELEVLRLVALGRSTAQIARDLRISEHTVRNHVRHFRAKLNASTKLEAVLTALRLGLVRWS